jgi:hypothetical protein
MIEKAPIVRQICQIAKCSPLRASHTISQMHQCRGAASSLGSKTPLQAMKDWRKLKPELFKKKPYYLPGCDN